MNHHTLGSVPMRAALITLLIVLGLLALAAPAMAAPDEPILTVAELRAKLDTAPLDGYMKTVLQGYTIEQIPVTVESIMDYSWGSLILFEAYGTTLDKIGSLGPGMSGSPIYVSDPDDGGAIKLVGALSYGMDGTVGGMCMATPVEYMSALEADYDVQPPAPGRYPLEQPVDTDAGRISSVRLVRGPEAATKAEAADGQIVMAPLGLVEIGGLDPRSRAYKELAGRLHKLSGRPVQAAVGGGLWSGPPAPDLAAGSAVCQLFSRGAVWYGAAGTVTYVHDGIAMAFGHSSWWVGPCDTAMTAGYVAATWPTIWGSYKMISPRDVKGTIVQDRNWGIAGVVGRDPDMFPVTTHVTLTDTGREVTDSSEAAQWTFYNNPSYAELAGDLPAQALWDACDASSMPGSATTKTTVVVSDDTGEYTVELNNVWSSSWDITWDPIYDAYTALYSLADDPDGVIDARIESLDFDATVSSQIKSARMGNLILADALHTGDNPVQVTYYRYGSRELQTIDGTLTIPEGTPLRGGFEVMPASWGWYWDSGDYYYENNGEAEPPATLEEIVDNLNTQPMNSDLLLTFYPRHEGEQGDSSASYSGEPAENDPYAPIEVSFPTDWVFDGYIWADTWEIRANARPKSLAYNGTARVFGLIEGATEDMSVGIYKQAADSTTQTYVKTVTAVYEHGYATFSTKVRNLQKNTALIAKVAGADGYLPASDSADVKVAARATMTAKVSGRTATLTARVLPADTTGLVQFQVYKGGRWRPQGVYKNVMEGKATLKTSLSAGTYRMRAKFYGSTVNKPDLSPVVTFTVG